MQGLGGCENKACRDSPSSGVFFCLASFLASFFGVHPEGSPIIISALQGLGGCKNKACKGMKGWNYVCKYCYIFYAVVWVFLFLSFVLFLLLLCTFSTSLAFLFLGELSLNTANSNNKTKWGHSFNLLQGVTCSKKHSMSPSTMVPKLIFEESTNTFVNWISYWAISLASQVWHVALCNLPYMSVLQWFRSAEVKKTTRGIYILQEWHPSCLARKGWYNPPPFARCPGGMWLVNVFTRL